MKTAHNIAMTDLSGYSIECCTQSLMSLDVRTPWPLPFPHFVRPATKFIRDNYEKRAKVVDRARVHSDSPLPFLQADSKTSSFLKNEKHRKHAKKNTSTVLNRSIRQSSQIN